MSKGERMASLASRAFSVMLNETQVVVFLVHSVQNDITGNDCRDRT